MGVKNDEFIIFESNSDKKLKILQKALKKIFKKDSDLKYYLNCIGKIGGGMNIKYSLVITPTGYNGGFDTIHQGIIEDIKKLTMKISSKKDNISMKILSFTDWGTCFQSEQKETLKLHGVSNFLTNTEDELNIQDFEEIYKILKSKNKTIIKIKKKIKNKYNLK